MACCCLSLCLPVMSLCTSLWSSVPAEVCVVVFVCLWSSCLWVFLHVWFLCVCLINAPPVRITSFSSVAGGRPSIFKSEENCWPGPGRQEPAISVMSLRRGLQGLLGLPSPSAVQLPAANPAVEWDYQCWDQGLLPCCCSQGLHTTPPWPRSLLTTKEDAWRWWAGLSRPFSCQVPVALS